MMFSCILWLAHRCGLLSRLVLAAFEIYPAFKVQGVPWILKEA